MCLSSLILSCCFLLPHAGAQQRTGEIWPQVHADRRISFQLKAPQARNVLLEASFLSQAQAMKKDAEGTWSFTSEPLAPEIYDYSFAVDGLKIADPLNPFVKVWRRASRSMVLVPGEPPMFFEEQNVPHGTVQIHRYHSKSLNTTRGLYVYTPPGYETATDRKYPVLYLLHGSGDTEDAWTIVGRANVIADNALAAGRAQPMIVAMPYGHTPGVRSDAGRSAQHQAFAADLLGDVIPLVEKNYRVHDDAENRAITGLSMGGGQALRIGLAHSKRFAWIAAFSSGVPSEEQVNVLLAKPDVLNEDLKLLWVGCGRQDFLFERNKQLLAALKAKGVRHTPRITEGSHNWRVWRRYLNEVLPLLFQSDK
jgi:enterochelin esterase family protein